MQQQIKMKGEEEARGRVKNTLPTQEGSRADKSASISRGPISIDVSRILIRPSWKSPIPRPLHGPLSVSSLSSYIRGCSHCLIRGERS